jgi:dTDP-4-dehydrorhamnose reductase
MKLMIIGASGYLGNTIYKKLRDNTTDEIYGTSCKSNNQELLSINVLSKLDIKKLLSYKPDIIIWSIYDFEEEMNLSLIGLTDIVNSISDNVRLIYVSTTVGKGKDQTENVIPNKRKSDEYLSNYANGKIQGEIIVRSHPNHVIVRPGSIYGYDYDGKMDLRMKELLQISKTGETYSRTENMYTSFVHVQDLADSVIELAYTNFKGIINISGETPISYYDFNINLAKLLNIDPSFIISDSKPEDVYHNLNNDKRKLLLHTVVGHT